MTQNQQHVNKIEEYVYKCLQKDELTNEDLVQIIERVNSYLNLKTIQKYADDNSLSYNGVKKHREIINIFGCKLVADND
jgi:hypothetical protein